MRTRLLGLVHMNEMCPHNQKACFIFWVCFLSNGMVLTTQRMSQLHLLSWSQNANGLVLAHHDLQTIKSAVKIYWASGNNVLDTFSTFQFVTICCLCHANIMMPSEICQWLELSNLRVAPSQVTKMPLRALDPLYTYILKVWAREYSQMWYAVPGLQIQNVSSISIWGTLAHLLTVKLEEHLAFS